MGTRKLLDFGLAQVERAAEAGESVLPTMLAEAHLTTPGTALGTVEYMSPEQVRGEHGNTSVRVALTIFVRWTNVDKYVD